MELKVFPCSTGIVTCWIRWEGKREFPVAPKCWALPYEILVYIFHPLLFEEAVTPLYSSARGQNSSC